MYFIINISYSFFHFYIHIYFRFYFYLQILRAKEVCIPEEYSFCSSIDSDLNVNSLGSEDDIDSKEVELRGGNEMSVAYDWNHRNDDNNHNSDDNNNNNERKILSDRSINKCKVDFNNDNDVWKKKKKENKNGKRKDTEKEEEVEKVLKKEKAMSGKQQINQKNSAGLWMKNQKNGVLLE